MAFASIKLHRENGGANAVNFIHLVLRTLQFIIGIIVIIMYATQPSYEPWRDSFKFSLGIAAGALAVATAPLLAPLPFIFGYHPVALAFLWDFIVMIVYAATFAYFKKYFPYGQDGDVVREVYHEYGVSYGRINVMRAAVSVDLTGMLLWLCTLLMALGLLGYRFIRGRSGK